MLALFHVLVAKKPDRKRPVHYTTELASAICARISQGESLRSVCRSPNMPARKNVYEWLAAYLEFQDQYARAREECCDRYAEEIVDIADAAQGKTSDEVRAAQLRIDARKWVASKLKPRKYGERLGLDHSGDVALRSVPDEQLDERIKGLAAKAGLTLTGIEPAGKARVSRTAGREG